MYDYKSPIPVFQKQIETQIEGEILKAVCKTGVVVDKDELLKALKYDREQYEKGYQDGLDTNGWIPCSERLPEEHENVLCSSCDGDVMIGRLYTDSIFGKLWGFLNNGSWRFECIVAWQPLPEPYKRGKLQ